MSFRAVLLAVALLCALAPAVRAHPEIDDALSRLNPLIAAAPTEAALYLERGELYAKHAEWTLAEANYLRAAELTPGLPRLALARGALAFATGQFAEARAHFDHAIVAAPTDPEARILRARTLARLDHRPAALADYTVAFAHLSAPGPELYLDRAALCATPTEALRSLDEGLARLGPLVTLQLRAIELELSLQRTDAALARLDTLIAATERPEPWLKRRGDLLAAAGRSTEARVAYTAALAAIAALPAWLAQSPDTARLSAELTRLAHTSTPR